MVNQNVIDELIKKSLDELKAAEKPSSYTRAWTSSRGYRFLVQWSNAVLLRMFVRKLTVTFSRSEHRTKTQLDDAARSVVSNIEEGYKRPTTKEYLIFLGYSEASLEEVHGLINQCVQDGFVKSVKGSGLEDIGIDLKSWNEYCQNPENATELEEFKGNYRKLSQIKGYSLTYEMFRELINKTDYLLQKLVQSLEQKQQNDKLSL